MTHNKNHERRKAYPGIGYVGGSNRLSGLYGVNNGIIDSKGTGIMHLFYNQYDKDFVHSGCTLIKVDDDIYYGNKNEKKLGHQTHLVPIESKTINGHIYYDAFELENGALLKEDYVSGGYGDNKIGFRTTMTNQSSESRSMTIYSFVNVNPFEGSVAMANKAYNQCVIGDVKLQIHGDGNERYRVVQDAPTGFLYRTTQSLFYEEEAMTNLNTDKESISLLRGGKEVILEPGETIDYNWQLIFEGIGDDKKNYG